MPRPRQPSVRKSAKVCRNALGSFDATSIDAATATAQRARLQLVPEATGDDRCANAKSPMRTGSSDSYHERCSDNGLMQSNLLED